MNAVGEKRPYRQVAERGRSVVLSTPIGPLAHMKTGHSKGFPGVGYVLLETDDGHGRRRGDVCRTARAVPDAGQKLPGFSISGLLRYARNMEKARCAWAIAMLTALAVCLPIRKH